MKQAKKEIEIYIILDYNFLSKVFFILKHNDIKNDSSQYDLPQVDLQKKIEVPSSHLGILFCKEEYEKYLKPLLSEEGAEVTFPLFVRGLLNRKGSQKKIFLRSSFIERLNEEDALSLKSFFIESGFDFKFKVILESPVSLFTKDFFSLYYQLPSNFRFSKPESFFQNIFKAKMQKAISGLKILAKTFGKKNIHYSYNEDLPSNIESKNEIFHLFSELGLEKALSESYKDQRLEINPLFFEYIRCKLLDGSKNIHKEVSETREITKKFKLKNNFSYKELSADSTKELEYLSEQIDDLLSEDRKPLKKFLFIKTDVCLLKHIIPFVKHDSK